MNTEENHQLTKENPKCTECMTFYASEAYGGLCSSCYKYHLIDLEMPSLKRRNIKWKPCPAMLPHLPQSPRKS